MNLPRSPDMPDRFPAPVTPLIPAGETPSPGALWRQGPMAQGRDDPGEIDLLALLGVLMRGWRWLLAGLCAGVLVSVLLSLLLPRHYTSQAKVVAPGAEMLRGLSTLNARFSVAGLTPVVDGSWLYARFQEVYSARDGQMAFLSSPDRYHEGMAQMSPEARDRLIAVQADGITLTLSENLKKPVAPFPWVSLAVTADDPDMARDRLTGWMNASAAEVLARARTALTVQRDSALEAARTRLAQMQRQAAAHRDVQINRLTHALSLARAAGIHRPLWVQGYTLSDDPDFPVSLGESGLSEKLTLLKNDTDLSALSTALRDQQLQVQALAALSTDGLQAVPYRLLASPSLPLRADGAGPGLLLALCVLLSLILSAGGLLLRDALRTRQISQAAPAAERNGV